MLDEIDKEYRAGIEQREVLRIKIAVLEELQLKLRQNQPLVSHINTSHILSRSSADVRSILLPYILKLR